jgi:hypothetical protein
MEERQRSLQVALRTLVHVTSLAGECVYLLVVQTSASDKAVLTFNLPYALYLDAPFIEHSQEHHPIFDHDVSQQPCIFSLSRQRMDAFIAEERI